MTETLSVIWLVLCAGLFYAARRRYADAVRQLDEANRIADLALQEYEKAKQALREAQAEWQRAEQTMIEIEKSMRCLN